MPAAASGRETDSARLAVPRSACCCRPTRSPASTPRPTPPRRRVDARGQRAARHGALGAAGRSLFGYVMLSPSCWRSPTSPTAAKQGGTPSSTCSTTCRRRLAQGARLASASSSRNYLCALAGLTSTSRMIFAFARDGGLPGSRWLRRSRRRIARRRRDLDRRGPGLPVDALYSPAFSPWPPAARSSSISPTRCRSAPASSPRARAGRSGPFRLGAWSKPLAVITCSAR